MTTLIAKWLIVALSFLLATYLIPGISVQSFYTALLLAFFWGIINLFVKPVVMILTLPINILTLGLFTFVINGFLLWLLGTFVKGFAVDGFFVAILGAIVITFFGWFGGILIGKMK